MILGLDRIPKIDVVTETVDGVISLQIIYTTPCIVKLTSDPKKWPVNTTLLQPVIELDPHRFWHPKFLVRNALENQILDKPISRMHTFDQILKTIFVIYEGTVSLYCDFDFYFYPMDKQTCTFTILMYYPMTVVEVVSTNLWLASGNPMPPNSMWILKNSDTKISTFLFKGYNYSQVDFNLHLQRRPNWHLLNLFGPSFILCFLQLASFFIPGALADRASYNVTILLAFTVLQGQIVNSIPETPKPVIIQYYVFFEMVYSMIITIYSCVFCWFLNHFPDKSSRIVGKVYCRSVKVWQLVEAIAFAVATFCLTLLNAIGFSMFT